MGACRIAPSLRAHSSAREEWADPSMPTVIPDIFCLLLTGLPREQSRTHPLLSSPCPGRARDLRRMFGGLSSRIPPDGGTRLYRAIHDPAMISGCHGALVPMRAMGTLVPGGTGRAARIARVVHP